MYIPMLSNLNRSEQDILYYIVKKGYMLDGNPADFETLKKEFGNKIDLYELRNALLRLERDEYIHTKTKNELKDVCNDKRNIPKGVLTKISLFDECKIDINELYIGIINLRKLERIKELFKFRIYSDRIKEKINKRNFRILGIISVVIFSIYKINYNIDNPDWESDIFLSITGAIFVGTIVWLLTKE